MNHFKLYEIETKRDSFSDRICDDLCEVLLSYLSFEEKIRFECVSKQFQRCVYIKQKNLEIIDREGKNLKNMLNKILVKSEDNISESQIDLIAFENVLKKCQFINKIIISYDLNEHTDKVLQLITKYCVHLKSIEFNFNNASEDTLIEFGKSCGQKLESIEFLQRDFNKSYKTLLKYCPNLSTLTAVKLTDFIANDKQLFMTKLKKISLICLSTEILLLDMFFSQHKNTVKRFGIISGLNNLDEHTINILMTKISGLKKMEQLYFEFNFMKGYNQSFDKNMKRIAYECPKIKRLSIHSIINNSIFGSQIFQSINYFNTLKFLNLDIYHTLCNCGNEQIAVKSLKDCKALTNLVLNYPKLNDKFFEGIDLYLPKLKFLSIYANNITDNTLHSLSKLKYLTVVKFNSLRLNLKFSSVTDIGICYLSNNCPEIKSIRFNRRPNITHRAIDALIELALSKPRIYFSHFFGSLEEESNEDFDKIFLNKSLPKNLKIDF